jgi:hypothetical protein
MSAGDAPEQPYAPIPGYPGYFATASGQIWSFLCRFTTQGEKTWRRLKEATSSSGYLVVGLPTQEQRKKRGTASAVYVHRLVLLALVGPCPDGSCACHINDVKTDNRLENLRWGTPRQNSDDAIRNKRSLAGMRNKAARLDDLDVLVARLLLAKGLKPERIAVLFDVSIGQLQNIASGQSWSHLPSRRSVAGFARLILNEAEAIAQPAYRPPDLHGDDSEGGTI